MAHFDPKLECCVAYQQPARAAVQHFGKHYHFHVRHKACAVLDAREVLPAWAPCRLRQNGKAGAELILRQPSSWRRCCTRGPIRLSCVLRAQAGRATRHGAVSFRSPSRKWLLLSQSSSSYLSVSKVYRVSLRKNVRNMQELGRSVRTRHAATSRGAGGLLRRSTRSKDGIGTRRAGKRVAQSDWIR